MNDQEAFGGLATPEQKAMEQDAVRLLQDSAIQLAARGVADRWRNQLKPSTELQRRADFEFEQVAFCGVMNALNRNPRQPKLHAFGRFSHTVDGMRIPGTKAAHPNPDYIYRIMPVDGASRYRVHGQAAPHSALSLEIGLLTKQQVYIGHRSARDLVMDADGAFTITIDSDPAGGRPNHFQSTPEADHLLVRDIISETALQRPYRLTVEREGPASFNTGVELMEEIKASIKKFADDVHTVSQRCWSAGPANTFAAPTIHQQGWYHVAQAYAPGHFKLADDEALVVNLTLGDAGYAVVPVTNGWGGIGDYLNHLGTLSTSRAVKNANDSYSFVVALQDPGVHNWVDTAGLHEGLMFIRWASFAAQTQGDRIPPSLKTEVVKLTELERVLPRGTQYVSAADRRLQLERHARDYRGLSG